MNQYYCTTGGRECVSCPPQPQPPQPSRCPCTDEFRALLDLLCSPQLSGLINLSAFGFVGSNYLLGVTATAVAPTAATPNDNLSALSGTFACGSGCDTISVSGALAPFTPGSDNGAIGITQAVLCDLTAIVFEALATETTQAANFQTISQILSQALHPNATQQPCTASGAVTLLRSAAARTVTLTAGPLVLRGVTVLGELGDVLVLANSADSRFYLVCSGKIGFLG